MGRLLPKEVIKAVHKDDLEELLHSLKIFDEVIKGKMKCKFCKTVITPDNLHSIFPHSGNIQLVCSDLNCVKQLYDFLREDTELL